MIKKNDTMSFQKKDQETHYKDIYEKAVQKRPTIAFVLLFLIANLFT